MIRQWNSVEAQFASNYGLTLRDIFDMSWRRFRVLFSGVFTWNEAGDESPAAAPQRIADTVDWSSLKHTSVAELTTSSFPGQRVKVSKDA